MTAIITISDGTSTVNLNTPTKWEPIETAHIIEIPIPGRAGGQVQYLGSKQIGWTITGFILTTTAANADLVNLQLLHNIQNNAAADATLTVTYAGTTIAQVQSKVRVVEFDYWPIKGSSMWSYQYMIRLLTKG